MIASIFSPDARCVSHPWIALSIDHFCDRWWIADTSSTKHCHLAKCSHTHIYTHTAWAVWREFWADSPPFADSSYPLAPSHTHTHTHTPHIYTHKDTDTYTHGHTRLFTLSQVTYITQYETRSRSVPPDRYYDLARPERNPKGKEKFVAVTSLLHDTCKKNFTMFNRRGTALATHIYTERESEDTHHDTADGCTLAR